MENNDFDTARKILVETNLVNSNEEIRSLYEENERREKVWNEINTALKSIVLLKSQIESGIRTEPWIKLKRNSRERYTPLFQNEPETTLGKVIKADILLCLFLCVLNPILGLNFINWLRIARAHFHIQGIFDYQSMTRFFNTFQTIDLVIVTWGFFSTILLGLLYALLYRKNGLSQRNSKKSSIFILIIGVLLLLFCWCISLPIITVMLDPIFCWIIPFSSVLGLILVNKAFVVLTNQPYD